MHRSFFQVTLRKLNLNLAYKIVCDRRTVNVKKFWQRFGKLSKQETTDLRFLQKSNYSDNFILSEYCLVKSRVMYHKRE